VKNLLVSILAALVMGVCLAVCGIVFPDWRYFLLLAVYILYGAVQRIMGWIEVTEA